MSKCECKNCINYNACEDWDKRYNGSNSGFPYESEGDKKPCEFFKDKSLFVELPCKYNSTVWEVKSLPRVPNYILELNVVGFRLGDFPSNKGHKRPQKLICYANGLLYHRDLDDIGKTIFLTKEEAERKLREVGK